MLTRWLGMAALAGGACLLAACSAFGEAPTGGAPAEERGDAGTGPNGEEDGGANGQETDAGPATSVALLGEWKSGLEVTIPAGTNRLLLVTVHIEDSDGSGNGAEVESVRLGQRPLARVPEVGRVVDRQSNKQNLVELWYLNETGIAAVENGEIQVGLSRKPAETPFYTHAFFSGVDQRIPFGPSAKSTGGRQRVTVGPVFAQTGALAVAACDLGDDVKVDVKNASRGVTDGDSSHAILTAFANGADADLSVTLELSSRADRQATSLVVLNPAR